MRAYQKISSWCWAAVRFCLIIAVLAAPIATSLQMLAMDSLAASVPTSGMPCHGAQRADDQTVPASNACTCSPWCHAAVAAAFEFYFAGDASKMAMPVAPPMTEKTADARPHFKPPIA